MLWFINRTIFLCHKVPQSLWKVWFDLEVHLVVVYKLWDSREVILSIQFLTHASSTHAHSSSTLAFSTHALHKSTQSAAHGSSTHTFSNTRIFIDVHLPRLTHLHDARHFSHVCCISVWTCPNRAHSRKLTISRKGFSLVAVCCNTLNHAATPRRCCVCIVSVCCSVV